MFRVLHCACGGSLHVASRPFLPKCFLNVRARYPSSLIQTTRSPRHLFVLVGVAMLAVSAAPIHTHGSRTDGSHAAHDHDQVQYWRCLLHQYARTALAWTAVVLPTITTASGHARCGARHRSCRVPASAEYQRARLGTRTAWAKFIIFIICLQGLIKQNPTAAAAAAEQQQRRKFAILQRHRKGRPETQPNNPALPYIAILSVVCVVDHYFRVNVNKVQVVLSTGISRRPMKDTGLSGCW